MKGLVDDMEHCFICGNPNIHIHHVFFGTANRKVSEKYKMLIPLCQKHHTGNAGVHFNKDLDLGLKAFAQKHFEKHIGDRTLFMSEFGKNYLDD